MVVSSIIQNAQYKIAEILQSWPLYRRYQYSERLLQDTYARGIHTTNTYFRLPKEIILLCPRCAKEQRWSCSDTEVSSRSALHLKEYRCKNCAESWIEYFFWWTEKKDGGGLFFKAGQYPPLSHDPASELKLDEADLDLYKKALTSRNFSFGIGAVAYLRRVVENRMNALLDLVVETAKASGVPPDKLAGVDAIRQSRRFEDKVEFASSILPSHLKPDGHNPFDVLHDFTSEGLHSKSEEECLVIFDRVRIVFEYLFRNLTVGTEDAKTYVKNLTELASRKTSEG